MNDNPQDGFAKAIAAIRQVAEDGKGRATKSGNWDAAYYNWGIVLAISLGVIGTALPPDGWWPTVASKILTGLSTAIFAVDRSLELGSRWRFHRRLRHGYQGVLNRLAIIDAYDNPADKSKALGAAIKQLDLVSEFDCNIPGVTASSTAPPSDATKNPTT